MSTSVAALLDEATAEAKRNGHGTVEFAHVWSALLRADDPVIASYGTPDPPLDEQLENVEKTWEPPAIGDELAALVASDEGLAPFVAAVAERARRDIGVIDA